MKLNTTEINIRHRSTAIVETNAGILIVQESNLIYNLPGGGVHQGESNEAAAIRELQEETGLDTVSVQFLIILVRYALLTIDSAKLIMRYS